MQTLITGANRGLGLEFARQCLDRGDRVLACCRSRSGELDALAGDRLSVVDLDVGDAASVAAVSGRFEGKLDLLVNNAGIYGGDRDEPQAVGDADPEVMAEVYRVNVIGPALLLKTLGGRLADGAKVANISSGYGSVENAGGDWPVQYCCSKAALNMLSRIAGQNLTATVVSMSPGWVRTDMGGPNATLSPEESVGQMLATIDRLGPSDSGGYFGPGGEALPF